VKGSARSAAALTTRIRKILGENVLRVFEETGGGRD